MTEVHIDPQTGYVDPPIYPCIKPEGGLCKVRTKDIKEFDCVGKKNVYCSYQVEITESAK